MFDEPFLTNQYPNIENARASSLEYLKVHKDIESRISDHLWAFHEMGDLVPQTTTNFNSGHFFPYSQSYQELENSYHLCLMGFYRSSFEALRSSLELGILGVYFAIDDKEHENVRPWISSQEPTPILKRSLRKLEAIELFKQFDQRFGIARRISYTYDELSNFVHTRGYYHGSMALARANVNNFSPKSFEQYSSLLFSVVPNVITVMLLKYPIGMQGLPLDDKFGLNSPAGGFLEWHQMEKITKILDPVERAFLKELSDRDPSVIEIVRQIESMPDLPESEWQKQVEEFNLSLRTSEKDLVSRAHKND